MKILVVTQYWHPENGVPQRRWLWLANLLRESGHAIRVVAPPAHYLRKVSWGDWLGRLKLSIQSSPEIGTVGERIYRCLYVPASSSLTSRAANQAIVALASFGKIVNPTGEIRKWQPDLVVATVPALPTALVGRLVASVLRVPYILDVRDAWPELLDYSAAWNAGVGPASMREKMLSKGPLQLVSLLTRFVLDGAIKNADGVMVTADRLRTHVIEKYGLDGDDVATIRNVFPVDAILTKERKVKHPGDCLNVLYAGTLGRAQGLQNAVEAAELARNMGLAINLKFVGAGAASTALRELAENSEALISVEPRHPANEMEEFYQWADTALVHLTDWEPLQMAVPSKTFELISSGVHVTAVAEGETRDIVEGLKAGIAVSPGDPLALAEAWQSLIKNPTQLKASGAGRDWVICERTKVAPSKLLSLVERVGKSGQ